MFSKRKTLLINKWFQLRVAIYVTSWLLPLSCLYPVILYWFFQYFLKYAEFKPIEETLAQIRKIQDGVLWRLVALQVIFMAVTFIISIFMSHRIAGPLYKLRRAFDEVKNGNLNAFVKFRKYDHFAEVADNFNIMMGSVRDRLDHSVESVSTSIARLEKMKAELPESQQKNIEDALTELRKIREEFATRS